MNFTEMSEKYLLWIQTFRQQKTYLGYKSHLNCIINYIIIIDSKDKNSNYKEKIYSLIRNERKR